MDNNNVVFYKETQNNEPVYDERAFMEELTTLRDMTKLNPIEYFKVYRARKQAEQLRDVYIKYEPNDVIGTDYSVANDLEYGFRMDALCRSVEEDWKKYISIENDGYGLFEYANDVLQQRIKEVRSKRQR